MKTFRQGFSKEQTETIDKFIDKYGTNFSDLARKAIEVGADNFAPSKKEPPIYKTFNMEDKMYKTINHLCKKHKMKKSEIVRDLIMEFLSK